MRQQHKISAEAVDTTLTSLCWQSLLGLVYLTYLKRINNEFLLLLQNLVSLK